MKPETEELKASLRRAFGKNRNYSILMDYEAAQNDFLFAAWNLAVKEKWIHVKVCTTDQDSWLLGSLTQKGNQELFGGTL